MPTRGHDRNVRNLVLATDSILSASRRFREQRTCADQVLQPAATLMTHLDKFCTGFYCAANVTPEGYLAGPFAAKGTDACGAGIRWMTFEISEI